MTKDIESLKVEISAKDQELKRIKTSKDGDNEEKPELTMNR